jgi:hypothetical protein
MADEKVSPSPEKASSDMARDEKHATEATRGEDLVDATGRRGSVALNVVENPLKVC